MAVNRQPGSAVMASLAAPLPRPPHPTKPTLMMSLPAAWADLAKNDELLTAAAAPPAAKLPLRKDLRPVSLPLTGLVTSEA